MMELYLVKEEVKVTDATIAFSMTKDYNDYISRLERNQFVTNGFYESKVNEESRQEDDRDRVLLKVTNFPVSFKSICSEESEHSEKFAKRLKRKLLPEGRDEFENLDVMLIISDRPNSLDGCFVISSSGLTHGSKADILKRFKEDYNDKSVYGNVYPFREFKIEVSLGHLPTGYVAVSPPRSVINLKVEKMNFRLHHNQVRNCFPVRVPTEVREWWEQGTGFIYTKLSVKVALCADAVDRVYDCSDDEKLKIELKCRDYGYVEISCKDGKFGKCHGNILAEKSEIFNNKCKEMLKAGKGEPWKLEMDTSKNGVEAFMGYIYCGYVSGGLESCSLALGLCKVGLEKGVWGLQHKMEEIIMAKGSSDFEYFSVKGALDLFLYGRSVDSTQHLRDKAVRVMRNYLRTARVKDQLQGSEEYKEMLRDPELGIEITTLYAQL